MWLAIGLCGLLTTQHAIFTAPVCGQLWWVSNERLMSLGALRTQQITLQNPHQLKSVFPKNSNAAALVFLTRTPTNPLSPNEGTSRVIHVVMSADTVVHADEPPTSDNPLRMAIVQRADHQLLPPADNDLLLR